ncbi:MAG: hypothetical protein H6618_02280 [Deltaproteobacteria bacterium]|nr:hypothetical protein [Deltaproteobacteria bacterium]
MSELKDRFVQLSLGGLRHRLSCGLSGLMALSGRLQIPDKLRHGLQATLVSTDLAVWEVL